MRPDLTATQGEIFDEARRVVIEVATTRMEDDVDAAAAGYAAYLAFARARGVSMAEAWTLMQAASQAWVIELVSHLAEARGCGVSEVLQQMAGSENARVLEQH